MIIDERFTDFINSYNGVQKELLEAVRKEAVSENVPIIRREMESYIKVMLGIVKPKRILEIGTAVGYSALLMAEYMPKDCTIVTMENYDVRIKKARENFALAGKENVITLMEGDACEILPTLTGEFDFVFMDAAKGQYLNYLYYVKNLMAGGAILITDNILCDGDIIESKYAVTRRNRTIHARMRDYLYEITHSDEFDTTLIPLGDGISLSVRK